MDSTMKILKANCKAGFWKGCWCLEWFELDILDYVK